MKEDLSPLYTLRTQNANMSDRVTGRTTDRFEHFRTFPQAEEYDDGTNYSPRSSQEYRAPQASQSDQMKKLAGEALGTGSIWAFELISFPFVMMRRSCQIYYPAGRSHLTPFTLVPVMVKLKRNKPLISLWKGFPSYLLSRGINMVSENVVNEATNWPVQVSSYSTLKKHCLHLLLKGSGFLITSPFYVSSFVESVQSYFANDNPRVYEFLVEGGNRLFGIGMYHTTWMIPMYQLLLPTAMFRIGHYCIFSIAYYTVMRRKYEKQQENSDNSTPVDSNVSTVSFYDQQFPVLLATFTGTFLADFVLYPFETVLHRLYVQGTRVLIDNMDTGTEVSGIQTQYDGVIDCMRTIVLEEGFQGFYQGFGAFILQFTLHAAGLKIVQYLFDKISTDFNGRKTTPNRLSRDF